MDFDANYMEKIPSQISLFLHENYSSKPRDDQFSLEGSSSLKGSNNFLQDFHSLENVDHLNGSSSSTLNNPIFPIQQTCYNPFNNSTLSSCLTNFDFFETKPYANHVGNNGALVPLMDNFSQSGGLGGLGHPQMIAPPINMFSPIGQSFNPFNHRDFSLTNSCKPSDEGSCSSPKMTNVNMALKSFSVTTTRRKGGRGRKMKPDVVKGQWTIEEDRLLIQLVERYGIRKWSQIAQLLNGRIGKQCRERWHNHLRPDIKKDIWSEEEDMILIKAHAEIGNKWAEIAKNLPGRTENSIKNHWNATKRRQLSKRKCRSKYPRQSSILQDYINGLSPEIINAGCRKKQPTNNNKINNNNTSYNGDNTRKSSNDQIRSSDSSSSNLFADEFDFGDEVPDFNFDDHMFEESSIDSLLDYVPNEEPGNATICHDDHFQEKQELDLVEMINQANF